MACTFSLCQAALTTAMMCSSIALGHDLGCAANAMLYAVNVMASLSLAPWVNSSLSPKQGLVVGFMCCSIYMLCFATVAAIIDHPQGWSMDEPWCQVLALVGAFFGGLGISISWTGQGLFFSLVVQQLTETERVDKVSMADLRETEEAWKLSQATSQLSSSFAVWIMVAECGVKFQFAVMQVLMPWSRWLYFLLPSLALFATASFAATAELNTAMPEKRMSTCNKAIATVSLWPDPSLWLLSFTNVAFGLSAAWVNSHVNGHLLLKAFAHPKYLGFASAMTTAIAGVTFKMSGCGSRKGPFMAMGSVAFLIIGLLGRLPFPNKFLGTGTWILAFYVLHGIGRGVFESTNKAAFGQTFPGEKGLGAFANLLVQTTLASVAGHILAALKLEDIVTYLLMAAASLILPGFLLAAAKKRAITGITPCGGSDAQLDV